MNDRCPTCHATGVDGLHAVQCALNAAFRDDITRHATTVGIPEVQAADLWAHLNDVYADGRRAHRAARNVIDLGWRPGVAA